MTYVCFYLIHILSVRTFVSPRGCSIFSDSVFRIFFSQLCCPPLDVPAFLLLRGADGEPNGRQSRAYGVHDSAKPRPTAGLAGALPSLFMFVSVLEYM